MGVLHPNMVDKLGSRDRFHGCIDYQVKLAIGRILVSAVHPHGYIINKNDHEKSINTCIQSAKE
jgi:hypothetical protein